MDGTLVLSVTGYSQDYELHSTTVDLRTVLRPGANTVAIHCRQTTGGQYIDIGIVDLVPAR